MTIKVNVSPRYMNRKASNAVGKSVFKSLTEPITNSDDSYRRLVEKGLMSSEKVVPIEIVYESDSRIFRVIDHAEGMTAADMEQNFSEYGKDTSGSSQGYGVRGLFGQGICDVLFYHEKGMIQSIFDNKLYICKFLKRKDGGWEIDPKATHTRVDDVLRKSLRIPDGNGTVVSFTLDPDTSKPRKLVERIKHFYMLRNILANSKRAIYFTEKKKGKENRQKLEYVAPTGELVAEWEQTLKFESFEPVQVLIQLFKSKEPLLATEENGLLVFDEQDAIYDRSFFGYELNYPGTETLFGYVQLVGARKIIQTKINQAKPEEILTDERDGFNTNHSFYKALESIIKPLIERYILDNKAFGKTDEKLSPEQKRNQRKALDLLDKVYLEVMDSPDPISNPKTDTTPPEAGLEFDRQQIHVTQGKTYGLGLNISLSKIPIGSFVSLASDNPEIAVNPDSFKVTNEMIKGENLARRHINIGCCVADQVGQITAMVDDMNATTVVTVVEQELIYPETLCFAPCEMSVRIDTHHRANLFVNTAKIPLGTKISFSVDKTQFLLEDDDVLLSQENIVYEDVALVTLGFIAETEETARLKATSLGLEAEAIIRISDTQHDDPTKAKSKFRDWEFVDVPAFWQCFYDSQPMSPSNGFLLVNKNHPLNRIYFGDDPSKESVSGLVLSLAYLAEILLNEALGYMFHEKWRQVKKSGGDLMASKDPYIYIRQYLESEKMRIGPEFYGLFVDLKQLQEHMKKSAVLEVSVN